MILLHSSTLAGKKARALRDQISLLRQFTEMTPMKHGVRQHTCDFSRMLNFPIIFFFQTVHFGQKNTVITLQTKVTKGLSSISYVITKEGNNN